MLLNTYCIYVFINKHTIFINKQAQCYQSHYCESNSSPSHEYEEGEEDYDDDDDDPSCPRL